MNAFDLGRKPAILAGLLAGLSAGLAAPMASADEVMLAPTPVIRIAMEGAYPPFNFIDPDSNELQGFEADLLTSICHAMLARCEIVQHEWDGIIKGLINREYDAIMSSLEITEKREKRIAFSDPYYRIPAVFVGSKEVLPGEVTPQALAGKRIGAVERSDHEAYLRSFYRDSEIVPYAEAEEANLDLLVGRLDAVFGNEFQLSKFLQSREGECCHVLGAAPAETAYRRELYGIGLRKEDEDLRARFNRAIAQVKADGTYDRIRAKYLSFDIK